MNITGSEKFEKFCKKHNDAQSALEKWVEEVIKASWIFVLLEPIQIMRLLMQIK